MNQRNHAKFRRAQPVAAIILAEAGVKDEEGLVAVEDATQIPNHLLLGRLLIN